MPEERQEGQGTPGDEDESRDTVSENLEVDFSASVNNKFRNRSAYPACSGECFTSRGTSTRS